MQDIHATQVAFYADTDYADPAMADFYDRIDQARRAKKWTRTRLAQALGIDQSVVSKALTKRSGLEKHALKLAEVLGVSLDWLHTGKAVAGSGPAAVEPAAGGSPLAGHLETIINQQARRIAELEIRIARLLAENQTAETAPQPPARDA